VTAEKYLLQFNPSRPMVDDKGRLSPELSDFLDRLKEAYNDNVDILNSDVTAAKNASTSFRGEPGQTLWTTDGSGVYPAGDPTADLVANFYDSTGTVIASRTCEGTLDSSAGTISVTDAAKATSGLTTSVTTVNDGTTSVRVDVELTLADGSKVSGSLAWNAVDTTTASTTPATGGSK